MRRFLLNLGLGLIVAFGAFTMTSAPATAMAEEAECEGGWELQCDGNVCCTVCQADGGIGSCKAAE